MIPLVHVLVLAALLFAIGLYCALVRTNAVRILMGIELMLNAVNLNLVAFSRHVTPETAAGQVFAIFVMTVAAAEAAIGLAIMVEIARHRDVVDIDQIRMMKW